MQSILQFLDNDGSVYLKNDGTARILVSLGPMGKRIVLAPGQEATIFRSTDEITVKILKPSQEDES